VLSSMKNGCPVKQIGWIEKNWADLPGKWLASNWKSRIQVLLQKPIHFHQSACSLYHPCKLLRADYLKSRPLPLPHISPP